MVDPPRRSLCLQRGRWRVTTVFALVLLAPLAHGDMTLLIGRAAPEIRARSLTTDEVVTLETYRGRPLLLAFVATWCHVCERVAPDLTALQSEHQGELVVIALSHEPRDILRSRTEGEPRRYPLLQCTGRTAHSYRATALPTLVLIDGDGVLRGVYQGGTPETLQRLRRDIAALLARR